MTKSSNSHFTRGAQLWAHNIRMCVQGFKNICLFGLLCMVCLLVHRVSQYMTFEAFYYLVIEQYVGAKLSISKFFSAKEQSYITFYSLMQQKWITLKLEEYSWTFWNTPKYVDVVSAFSIWAKNNALSESIYSFVVGVMIATILFIYRGRSVLIDNKLRGSQCVTAVELRKTLKRKRVASKIEISGLPLVKNTETQHILITGTTGAGKTNMLNELLPQIRMHGQRAIIVDVTGSFVTRI